MIADFRSDTVTKPTKAMKEAMLNAALGDDVFGDDPTVIELENKVANLFGMEKALFCPSGTMTNQLAIRVHCSPGSEVICDQLAHIFQYEGGGIAVNALSSVNTIMGNRGRINAAQVAAAINNPDDIHKAVTRLVSVENTMNKGGGALYNFADIKEIKQVCVDHHLKFHLDGARLFNAFVETHESPRDYGEVFDTISVCLSKGLGAPVGSLLIGNEEDILKARRFRKLMGGGWRQAGILAAAGIYALDNHVDRLRIDHLHAKIIGEFLSQHAFVKSIYPIETNIVIFELIDNISSDYFVLKMKELGVLCAPFGPNLVRLVTHLDINKNHIDFLEDRLKFLRII